jgi:hypothetical protein
MAMGVKEARIPALFSKWFARRGSFSDDAVLLQSLAQEISNVKWRIDRQSPANSKYGAPEISCP